MKTYGERNLSVKEISKYWRGGMEKRFRCAAMTISFVVSLVLLIAPVSVNASSAEPVVLKVGMCNELVMKMQMILSEHGYYTGDVDGQFGSETQRALINFQIDYKLTPDGVAGQQTLAALRDTDIRPSRDQAPNRLARQVTTLAKQLRSTPYVWGGNSPNGFDCSGYIYYIFHYFNLELPRMADEQYEVGISVKRSELQEGDLVYFSTYMPGPSHVGLYIGENKFIHASSAAGKVIITPLTAEYYQTNFIGARRVIKG